MRSLLFLLCLVALEAPAAGQQVCGRDDLQGAYGMQLSGSTTIGVNGAQPVAAIGRVEFDGEGGVSGVSSVNIAGYFLGNPVTGHYSFRTDCTFTFDLQDDSGALQHFRGVASEGGARAEIRQADPDTGEHGVLERTAAECKTETFQGTYSFALGGSASQFAADQAPGGQFSIGGTVTADGAGNLVFTSGGAKTTGSYQLGTDCIAEMELGVVEGDSAGILKMRGVLVRQGKLLLAVESDPARIATGRFTLQP